MEGDNIYNIKTLKYDSNVLLNENDDIIKNQKLSHNISDFVNQITTTNNNELDYVLYQENQYGVTVEKINFSCYTVFKPTWYSIKQKEAPYQGEQESQIFMHNICDTDKG